MMQGRIVKMFPKGTWEWLILNLPMSLWKSMGLNPTPAPYPLNQEVKHYKNKSETKIRDGVSRDILDVAPKLI